MQSVGDTLSERLKAIGAKNVKAEKTPDEKTHNEKTSRVNNIHAVDSYYEKPRLYLSDKDFSGVKDFSGGKEVCLVVRAIVTHSNSHISLDSSGKKSSESNVCLEILEIANISDTKDVKK